MRSTGKLFFTMLLTLCFCLILGGCGSKTIQGEISAIDGSTITVSSGTFTAMEKNDGEAPTKPEGEDGSEPPTKPEGEDGSEPPTKPEGESSGEAPSDGETQAPPNEEDADNADNSNNDTANSGESESNTPPDGAPQGEMGTMGSFTADGKTLTFDIADATITLSDGSTGSVTDLQQGNILSITYSGEKVSAITVEAAFAMGGQDSKEQETESADLSGATTVDGEEQTIDSLDYTSAAADENVLLVKNGGSLTAQDITVTKSGDSSDVNTSNFTGLNAAVCAAEGSTLTLSKATISSEAQGANAVFATGENAKITVSDTAITTKGDSSRGLDATYGGTIAAENMTINTAGAHCAPVATDRGEGTITVKNSTLTAAGDGSPCIYSTGDITAEKVTGTATGSQAAVIEGKNSITLKNSSLTGAGENGVMLYQSTSGDAAEGTASLSAENTSLATTSEGPMFYITNTKAKISLNQTELTFPSGILLNAAGNETNNWGTPGENGGTVTLNAKNQTLNGNILCDSISAVTLNVGYHSSYTGIINGENSGGSVAFHLGKTATLNLEGDSYVSVFTDNDSSLSNIVANGHTLYYDAENNSNDWLEGKTVTLPGGGSLTPIS